VKERPSLLYVSPVVPAVSGNGLAMRAGMVLQALAPHYRLSALVVSLYGSPGSPLLGLFSDMCRRVIIVPPGPSVPRPAPLGPRGPAWEVFPDEPFDVVHVFRLAALPFVRPWLEMNGHRPRRHLDLDDVESVTRRRLAALYRLNGKGPLADAEEAAAERSERLELEILSGFDRVYVCSESDRTTLRARSKAELCVLPNALPVPEPPPLRDGDRPFTLLFVGTLGYYPNEDAILHFCHEVVPLLRRLAPREFRVAIVGTGATATVQQLASLPEVRVIGAAPDVAPWYAEADAVVVPIRAGGGTRIKVLEAFGYRRPVVSTSIGVEGIDARPEEHLLVGDTPSALAEQCARLMADSDLGRALAGRAFSLFLRSYSTQAVRERMAELARPRPGWRSIAGLLLPR
jgi:glycosyltransferase involved in cell wall biosynthesis